MANHARRCAHAWAKPACCFTAAPEYRWNRPARRPPLLGNAPMCNMNRPGSVKEFAQCIRAEAVGPARAANTVSYKETNHGRCKQVVRCIRDAAIARCVKEAQTAYPLDGDDQGRNRTALTAAGFNP